MNNKKQLQQHDVIEFLPKDTHLRAYINTNDTPGHLHQYLGYFKGLKGAYVELILREDLTLTLKHFKPAIMNDCKCFIPVLNLEGKSVNSTYTLISKHFEPKRRNPGGSVYLNVYYEDQNDRQWKRLSELRKIKDTYTYIDNSNIRRLTKKIAESMQFDSASPYIEFLSVAKDSVQALKTIKEFEKQNIDPLEALNTLTGIKLLKDIWKIWKKNQDNDDESFWQQQFSKFPFVLSLISLSPIVVFHKNAYVGGKGIDNKGGNLVDFLYINSTTKNTALIEIKTPKTKLVESPYRNSSYEVSRELCGGVAQVLSYKGSLIREYPVLAKNSNNDFDAFNPLCVVVIGNFEAELNSNDHKKETFQRFRDEQKTVQIITYDELFAKVKLLIDLLEGKDNGEDKSSN
ncbi:Shedu immune nuclease family protein [Limnoraphis robusta Tam1]|uniref:Shedu immune nuclease family protein n=1 Tax=Limnoraphis robusta TaxID=1118279 RepID=UPI002B203076|nr:Shedu immune nuclease family protein [Limnoraphis robusta]MEA5496015.1 Shedu immune nuclease family protein [Limnoraphis robusta BA-68 BA1]MEA5543141.1 Shedu immune nuclease family protein [Limnoraphis robusta Tam1]